MIWIIHFVIITFLLFLAMKTKNDTVFIVPSFMYALFVFGQRWMTGTDFPNYVRYYLTDYRVREPIYRTIQVFLSENNLYFGLLIFIVFLITLFNNYRFIIKFDKHIIFVLYFYLLSENFFAQLSQIRQFAAISFFINAYFYAFEKKKYKSLLNLLLGAGFHSSILFLTPILFIRLNIDRIKALYLLLVAAILPLLDVTLILKLPFFMRYSHYLESVFNVKLSMFHYLKFYLLILIVFIYLWNLTKYRSNKRDQLVLNGILLNMLMYGMSFQFALMIRISFYFKIFEVLFLIYFMNDIKNYSKIITKTVVTAFLAVIYLGFSVTDPYNITNYQFRALRIRDEKNIEELYEEIRITTESFS